MSAYDYAWNVKKSLVFHIAVAVSCIVALFIQYKDFVRISE